MSISLELNFFYTQKNINRYQFPFQKDKQEIKDTNVNIEIPDSIFKYGKEKQQMSIKLFLIDSDNNIEHYFNIYYGKNSSYVNLDEFNNYSYEIILKNKESIKMKGKTFEFIEYDTIGNKDRKRLVLINYNLTYLYINKTFIDLKKNYSNKLSSFIKVLSIK